jgi:hypothetical protein
MYITDDARMEEDELEKRFHQVESAEITTIRLYSR